MRAPTFILFIIAVLIVSSFVGMLAYYSYNSPNKDYSSQDQNDPSISIQQALPTRPVISSTDPIKGSADAKIAIIEFGDFLCAACADMLPVLTEVMEENDVNLVWKDLPNTSIHPLTQKAAEAARCAGQQRRFWEYHNLLFENQKILSENMFREIALSVGADLPSFSACLESRQTSDLVNRTFNEALILGVDATPYFFIGNQRISGSVTKKEINSAIENIVNTN